MKYVSYFSCLPFMCLPGLIKISIGTSNSVQTAINFLYGKLPTITLDNVEDLLEVAEVLMIEELKAICISKLKTIRLNEDNCFKVLMMASRYDFDLENVSNFICANLPELLRKDEMLLLDKESVRFILTDPLLAYVSPDDFFRFLIKWVGYCERRRSDFVQLFSCLDKDALSANVLSTVDLNCLSETDKPLCDNFSGDSNRWCDMLTVYPPFYISGKHHLYAYNLKKKLWYTIPINDSFYYSHDVRACLISANSLVNYKSRNQKLCFYNLATQNGIEKRIEMTSSAETPDIKHVSVCGEKIYCVGNVEYIPKTRNRWKRVLKKDASCLCVSVNVDESKLTMRELISIRGFVQSVCVADDVICLLVPESKHIIVYSDKELLLTKFELLDDQLDEKSYICPRVRGGIYVVTKLHVLQLSIRLNSSDIIVCVSDILVQAKAESSDPWIREFPPRYEILPDKIVTITRCRGGGEWQLWYQFLPELIGFLDKEEEFEIYVPEPLKHFSSLNLLQITLPKETLLCPVDCPHCKYKSTTTAKFSSYDMDYYEPDSDSDCVYYDSDDYYPYDDDSDTNFYYVTGYGGFNIYSDSD